MIANFKDIAFLSFFVVWHCKVKTDLGCFVEELGSDWVAYRDVLGPLGHSACRW